MTGVKKYDNCQIFDYSWTYMNTRVKKAVAVREQQRTTETKDKIIKSAKKVFAEQGFDAASLRVIAEGAGVPHQIISYHFGSKEGLWEATIYSFFSELQDIGSSFKFDESGGAMTEKIRQDFRALIRFTADQPEFLKIMTQEAMADSRRYQNILHGPVSEIIQQARKYFETLQRYGIATHINVSELQILFHSMLLWRFLIPCESQMITGKLPDNQEAIEQQVEAMVSLLMGE